MRTRIGIVALGLAGLLLAGCDGSEGSASAAAPAGAWLLASAPAEEASGVASLKASAVPGDRVVMRGKIGGSVSPMTEGAAVFTVVDLAVLSCDQKDHDTCPTPWDYCCEPPDRLIANSATVRVVGEGTSPLAVDLRDSGFAPLDEVIVVGSVGPRPTEAVLIIDAEGLHKVGG